MNLALVWHFHQPVYKNPANGEYVLPWVNLHATKNYHQMGRLVRKTGFPCTFNFVPCLLEQLGEYARGQANDPFQRALEKEAGDLTEYDIGLLQKFVPGEHDAVLAQMKALQFLFSPLEPPGENRQELLSRQKAIHRDLIPSYKTLKADNLAALTTSPFYHPMLPLLFDSSCPPGEQVPARPFRRPEDVQAQLRMGRDYFREVFGFDPDGLWPSEGGVSQDVARAASESGFRLALTDENVLWKSLEKPHERKNLYRPYWAAGLPFFFRDRELSDLLSFEYQKWPEKDAVSDFIRRLEERRKSTPEDSICVVILDGENPWEFYSQNGVPFLKEFYSRLLDTEGLRPVFLHDYLKDHKAGREIELVPGTWLGDFSKWIGHPAKNNAWNTLSETRDRCGQNKEIFIAEGSDWFWWYGEADKNEFDLLFKSYIRAALAKSMPEKQV